MDRERINELILEYPDGELTESERALVEKSVAASAEHAAFQRRALSTWDLLALASRAEPRPGYITDFWNSVAAEEEKGRENFFGLLSFLRASPLRWASVAAMAVVLLVGVFTLNYYGVGPGADFVASLQGDIDRGTSALLDVERTLLEEPASALEVYGPWDSELYTYGGSIELEYGFNDLVRPAGLGSIY